METLFDWFNAKIDVDPVLQAAIAHLWFVTVHSLDDGNGRISARSMTDLQLARSDESKQRLLKYVSPNPRTYSFNRL